MVNFREAVKMQSLWTLQIYLSNEHSGPLGTVK